MARGGRSRGRGQKRKHSVGKREKFTKKQKSHLKQFGDIHPADERQTGGQKFKKFEESVISKKTFPAPAEDESSSESEVEVTDYQNLLSTLGQDTSSDSEENSSDGGGNDSGGEKDEDIADLSDEDLDSDTDAAIASDHSVMSDSAGGTDSDSVAGDDQLTPGDDYRGADFMCEADDDDDEEETSLKENDPFTKHFEKDIADSLADSLSTGGSWHKDDTEVPGLGQCVLVKPKLSPATVSTHSEHDPRKLYIKQSICKQLAEVNKCILKVQVKENEALTALQQSLFSVMNNYQDLCFMDRTHQNGEEIRLAYCLHALNHVLKTRSRVIAHNTKLKMKKDSVTDEYRDQGLTRPKVLIVLPFRESALRTVKILSSLLMSDSQSNVSNKKRFQKEFGIEHDTQKGLKPEDFEATFAGNIDDHFRIGLGIAKKSLKLYTAFYQSDIILASPLGLRTIIGADGEKERDFDFLSSIELLIFDQTDVFTMQNWDHIIHLMTHMHLQPQQSHGVDFSRIRMWTLSGWSKYYRQTLIFSDIVLPEINSIFNKHCHNYAGKLQVQKPATTGSICHIVVQLPQVFHRIPVASYSEIHDARFEFFKSKILPEYEDKSMAQTLIFIPSYFDFVRIRNLFRKKELSFQKLCEYTVDKSITRARSFFYHGKTHFLLFTERLHFYRRFRIRGIKHLIFYDLPTYAHFYSEVANMIIDPKRKQRSLAQNHTCRVLYTRYDVHKLGAVVGTDRALQMINSDKNLHMLMTGDT